MKHSIYEALQLLINCPCRWPVGWGWESLKIRESVGNRVKKKKERVREVCTIDLKSPSFVQVRESWEWWGTEATESGVICGKEYTLKGVLVKEAFRFEGKKEKKFGPFLDLCVSSLRRGHANLLCLVPILSDVPEGTLLYSFVLLYKLFCWFLTKRCGTRGGIVRHALRSDLNRTLLWQT